MESKISRRKWMQKGLLLSGAAAVIPVLAKAEQCLETPRQTSGPFYPGEAQFEMSSDLTRVPGSRQRAAGEIVHLHGHVLGLDCGPLANVNVEIWQACASGKYNNPRDPNPAPLDPNFRYWGETYTNGSGHFYFKTIKPGSYPATEDWRRPPHIHIRLSKLGYRELVTQMYFGGESLNDTDLILLDTPESERSQLVVDFKNEIGPDGELGLAGQMQLHLTPVRGR